MSTTDKMSQHRVATIEPWHITEEQFRPERNEIAESLFSLVNEYMGTRGNFEEGFGGETLCGCYIGGIYVKEQQAYPWKRKAFADFVNSMVNTANWLEILVEVDGESLDLSSSQVSEYRRSLDMRQGILSRQLVFTRRSADVTHLSWERFVSHDDPHLGAIRLSVPAIGHSRPVKLAFAIDRQKETRDHATSRVRPPPGRAPMSSSSGIKEPITARRAISFAGELRTKAPMGTPNPSSGRCQKKWPCNSRLCRLFPTRGLKMP